VSFRGKNFTSPASFPIDNRDGAAAGEDDKNGSESAACQIDRFVASLGFVRSPPG